MRIFFFFSFVFINLLVLYHLALALPFSFHRDFLQKRCPSLNSSPFFFLVPVV